MNEREARILAKNKILKAMNISKHDLEIILLAALDLLFSQNDEKIISYLSAIEKSLERSKPMKPKTTKQLIQEIVNRKNAEEKDLGLPASWTAEEIIYVAVMNMHERVVIMRKNEVRG